MNNYSPITEGRKRNKRLERMNLKRKDQFDPQNFELDMYFTSLLIDNSQTDRECEEKIYGRIF